MARLWNLIAVVALMLMPFVMQPAAAAPVQHHQATSAEGPAEHCPDERSMPESNGKFAVCAMICSAALPAADVPQAQRTLIVCQPAAPGLAQRLTDHDPEIATPPPRRS
jgi:hypothetical protein